ncbi:MAG: ABC transporter permease [Flavobacteriales bacterium]|nr:ABC transporter permease [Flavobacteriales bacterium]
MIRFFLQKLGYSLLTLWGVVTVIFLLFHWLPGDPARMLLDQNENSEQLQLVKKKYGFDQPLGTQYLWYLNDLSPISFHANHAEHYTYFNQSKYQGVSINFSSFTLAFKKPYLRESFQKNISVSSILGNTLPNTFVLATLAMGFAVTFGLLFGMFAALQQNTWMDRSLVFFSTIGMSLPSFFSAILFAWIFGFVLHAYTGLPIMGSLYEIDDYGENSFIAWKNIVLPALVLGIRPLGVITQLTRNSVLETLQQDYIRTAKAKGLNTFQIMRNHVLKNSLNPVVTAVSGWFASLLAGAVFVEYIFGWNGLGKEIVSALNTLDLPVIMGSVLTISLIFILINIVVDFIYAYLDPRLRN